MFVALLAIIFFLFSNSPILASERNIFGLHLTQTSDIESAAKIINSSNGDWGWATIVIRADQLDTQTWQDFFDNCRISHIIPIVRLATLNDNGSWQKPQYSIIDSFVSFLKNLNWPTTKRHIILFNEVNRAQEWGNQVDPKNYADISLYAIKKFKETDSNFFILSAGLDLAAPNKQNEFMSADEYIRQITLYQPTLFESFDGLASHSYPNHGFIGTPKDTGRHSILGYQWELSYLKSLGVKKQLPIFITETGWPHREGESTDNKFYTHQTTSQFLITAIKKWQSDPQILAVTPFIYNYPYQPFDHFSWLQLNGQMYPEYQNVVDLTKNKNNVEQITSYQFVKINLPIFMFPGKTYSGQLILKNNGQSIWGQGETEFCLDPQTSSNVDILPICTDSNTIKPGQNHTYNFSFTLNPSSSEKSVISWANLPPFEIKPFLPIISNAQIYQPNDSLISKIKRIIKQLGL